MGVAPDLISPSHRPPIAEQAMLHRPPAEHCARRGGTDAPRYDRASHHSSPVCDATGMKGAGITPAGSRPRSLYFHRPGVRQFWHRAPNVEAPPAPRHGGQGVSGWGVSGLGSPKPRLQRLAGGVGSAECRFQDSPRLHSRRRCASFLCRSNGCQDGPLASGAERQWRLLHEESEA